VSDPVPLQPVEDGRLVMGTVLDVSLRVAPGREADARAALEEAFATARRIEALADHRDPESPVARLNTSAGGASVALPPELIALLGEADRARQTTRGTFDVTVGPLVELWVAAARRGRAPDAAEIGALLARVGRPPRIGPEARARLETPGAAIDLGGIAKGFAVDRIAEGLRARGLARALVSFGRSSVWAGGQEWRLLVEADDGRPLAVVTLRDQSLSMSSSLSRFSEIEGVRYSHVIDPRDGRALRTRRMAVVVAATATDAEVLSTALLVLDEPEARTLLSAGVGEPRAEAWVREAGGHEWRTPGWDAATRMEREPDGPVEAVGSEDEPAGGPSLAP
jgi:thiamine biosynthesis lipoprotein